MGLTGAPARKTAAHISFGV